MSGVSATHPRQSQAQAPGPNPGAQPPKRAPAAEPPQQHPAGQTHPRETKAKHPAQTQRRSHPNAPRRQSRRSSTQPDIRTHARRRPSTQSKLQRHRHPNAPRRQGRSSTRQGKRTQRGPKQPAPGSGEPRKRLKLRSAMHKNVSCLGMTTQKVSANVRLHRTQRRQKALFFGGIPVSFGKTKEMGYKGLKASSPPRPSCAGSGSRRSWL